MLIHTGIGLATFGGVLATIYQFKPQTVQVSSVFLAVISYVLGELLATCIPRGGLLGRWFNPHPVRFINLMLQANLVSSIAKNMQLLW
jgi:OPT oligopeptide transporter protein